MKFKTATWKGSCLQVLDQRRLPLTETYIDLITLDDYCFAIKDMVVRGAPLIGVVAAYGYYTGVIREIDSCNSGDKLTELSKLVASKLFSTRPTAVNLKWALDEMKKELELNIAFSKRVIREKLLVKAHKIYNDDVESCKMIGIYGSELIPHGSTILTHCNAGALATSEYGTALSVIYHAAIQGKKPKVYVDETRPVLQGARLTAWELMKNNLDATLICDNMAASLMKKKKIDIIVTGADRIAANGDTANKIGTYSLAVLAKYHKIPFYIAAPFNTFDSAIKDGSNIPIEERNQDEVRLIAGNRIAPDNIQAYNPAFDVTPNELITSFITDRGIIRKPYVRNIKRMLEI